MQTKISFSKASELLLQNTNKINSSSFVSIFQALNHVSFDDIKATRNAPAFSNSAMDGYVCQLKDINKKLTIQGSIFAGDMKRYTIKDNHCFKIMTGALLPQNFGCVVPFECACDSGDDFALMPKDYKQNQNCHHPMKHVK